MTAGLIAATADGRTVHADSDEAGYDAANTGHSPDAAGPVVVDDAVLVGTGKGVVALADGA